MTITSELVRAYAASYTADELKALISETSKKLAENPDMITNVNTAGGASYARQERVKLSELLTLYMQAYDYLTGANTQSDICQFASPIFLPHP